MTFPVVAATNNNTQSSPGTTYTVNLPASIAAGDLLLVFITNEGVSSGPAITTPSGWTQIYQVPNSFMRGAAYYKVADGSEGATLSVTVAAGTIAATYVSARVTGYSGTPENGTATGSSTTPDPPLVTPSWGAADTLWIVVGNCISGGSIVPPTNYSNEVESFLASPALDTDFSYRNLNASSENPGTMSGNNTGQPWVAALIAIKPIPTGILFRAFFLG